MRIGIDIDDTIVDTSLKILDYCKEHLGHESEEAKDITLKSLQSDFQDPTAINFITEHFPAIMKTVPIKDNVLEVLNRLKDSHELYIITARGDDYFDSTSITINYLKDYNIPHDKLITRSFDKAVDCLEHEVDLMIDDKVSTIESVKSSGIKTLLFNSLSNEELETSSKRVSNWLEVEKEIEKLESQA